MVPGVNQGGGLEALGAAVLVALITAAGLIVAAVIGVEGKGSPLPVPYELTIRHETRTVRRPFIVDTVTGVAHSLSPGDAVYVIARAPSSPSHGSARWYVSHWAEPNAKGDWSARIFLPTHGGADFVLEAVEKPPTGG